MEWKLQMKGIDGSPRFFFSKSGFQKKYRMLTKTKEVSASMQNKQSVRFDLITRKKQILEPDHIKERYLFQFIKR